MSTDLMNIAAFKGIAPAAAFAALDPSKESLSDGIGVSYGIIGYKGKNWSLRHRGETYDFKRPDDGTPAPFLDVIILRQFPGKSKSYYPAGSYQEGNAGTRPTCASMDGVTPDSDAMQPQAPACASCPRNVFKTGPDGKKFRECSDFKRLAVLIVPAQTRPLFGAPLMEPVFLRVPPASLQELSQLGDAMQAQGFHYSSFITRIGFNPQKSHPQFTFRALQPLTDAQAPMVMPLREDPVSYRITGESEVSTRQIGQLVQTAPQIVQTTVVPPAQVAQPTNVVPLQQPVVHQVAPAPVVAVAPQPNPAQSAAGYDAFGTVTAPVSAPAPAPVQVAPHLAAGGVVQPVAQPVVAPVQVAPVVDPFDGGAPMPAPTVVAAAPGVNADTGITEDANADINARVKALLQR